jgi:predicted short-subunit dehydrogenase-like oxidoreductase (DUF2520 family)
MQVVIIGSGNTATVLGGMIRQAGHEIVQVVSRTAEHASRLAAELQCPYAEHWADTRRDAGLYLVALADTAFGALGQELSLPGRLVVHTAGAVAKTALLTVSEHSGVMYPLQSLRKEVRPYPEVPLLVDANREEDLLRITDFARTISRQVQPADDVTRLKLHLAAVMVNNFTNHLYALADDFCRREKIDFSLLLPLIRETAERISYFPPADMQTGPAVRGDQVTIRMHQQLIDKYKDIKELYDIFTHQLEHGYPQKPNN